MIRYEELGGNYFDEWDQQAVQKRLVRRLEKLGYEVTLAPSEPVAQGALLIHRSDSSADPKRLRIGSGPFGLHLAWAIPFFMGGSKVCQIQSRFH